MRKLFKTLRNMVTFSRNNIKISFNEEPTYFINESKGTVVCKINGYLEVPLVNGTFWGSFSCDSFIESVGVAKCSSNDTFNVARGKRIALAKAENKAYMTAINRLSDDLKRFENLRDMIYAFVNKGNGCIDHNVDYIESLSEPSHPHYTNDVKEPTRGKTLSH